jgi:PD-(D/E)XK nuclease superfamily protein
MMLTPTEKGAIAEAVIAAEAIKAGVRVWRPVAEGGRADLAFEIADRFVRVQCKSGNRRGDVIAVPTRTCRHTPHG